MVDAQPPLSIICGIVTFCTWMTDKNTSAQASPRMLSSAAQQSSCDGLWVSIIILMAIYMV